MDDRDDDAAARGGGPGRRSLLEDLRDYAVYAPLGAAVRLAESLPTLVDKGRTRAGSRVAAARLVGRFAVAAARRRAGPVLGPIVEPVLGPLATIARELAGADHGRPPSHDAGGQPPLEDHDGRDPAHDGGDDAPPAPTGVVGAEEPGPLQDGSRAGAAHLPIPGYDWLSASQVVPLLAGLSPPELAAVRRYEEQNRRRRTILGRITQLEAGAGDGSAG